MRSLSPEISPRAVEEGGNAGRLHQGIADRAGGERQEQALFGVGGDGRKGAGAVDDAPRESLQTLDPQPGDAPGSPLQKRIGHLFSETAGGDGQLQRHGERRVWGAPGPENPLGDGRGEIAVVSVNGEGTGRHPGPRL